MYQSTIDHVLKTKSSIQKCPKRKAMSTGFNADPPELCPQTRKKVMARDLKQVSRAFSIYEGRLLNYVQDFIILRGNVV